MFKNRKRLKYLSQSVLLEEPGLPHLNTIIILIVSVALGAFLAWATVMPINEVVSLKGSVIGTDYVQEQYGFVVKIPSDKINTVVIGNELVLSIPGVTNKNPIRGKIKQISDASYIDEQGNVYYMAEVEPDSRRGAEELSKVLRIGMETQIDVIVGSKTLIEYFLGPIFNVKTHAFSEQ